MSIKPKRNLVVLCLALILLSLSSGLFLLGNDSTSASPGRSKWSIVDTPSEKGAVVVSPSEINAFVIGSDKTFYAIDIPNSKVYKSTDAGVTWDDDLTERLESKGAILPAWNIAVAPNDPELVAVVTDGRTAVYVSEDGGQTWYDTKVPGLDTMLIASIVISPEYGGGNRDIAIGTRNPDSIATGDIWARNLLGPGSWGAQELGMDVSSISFSRAYYSDKTIVAIGSNGAGTYLCIGVRDTTKNSTDWDAVDPAKVEISETSGGSPRKDQIIVSDLALPSDYSARNAGRRVVYVAYSSETEADDVYRIEDDFVYRLNVKHGDKVAIASIAYHGTCSGGKALAGEVEAEVNSANALIRVCFNPQDCFPDWEKPSKAPTGGAFSQRANAQVAWSPGGDLAYCGTSSNNVASADDWANPGKWSGQQYDESSFSISRDDGDTWNQLSVIDTRMSKLSDFAFSADYRTLYLASTGSEFDSIWRSESELLGRTWERVLCPRHEGDIILRHSPEENTRGKAIFLAIVDTDYARYSLNKGQTWEEVWECPDITDLAVVNDEMFYILDDNLIHKCWWDKELWGGIWDWRRDVDTGLRHGYSISVSGNNFVFVGDAGDEGKVAYSSDGGATFKLTEAVPQLGEIRVIPDEDFNINRFIYATSGVCEVYRWTVGSSTSWRKLNPPCLGAFSDLAQEGGALYGAYGPGVARTLIPHEETITPDDWDSFELGLEEDVEFKPGTLRAIYNEDDEDIDLWAIDKHDYDFEAKTGCLWIYSDSFVLITPWLTSPALDESMPCDICTCQAEAFCFRWHQLPLAEEYELWIALDEEFSIVLYKVENIASPDCCNPAWCPPEDSFRFACGKTYYWKVRSCTSTEGERVHSRWSPPMYFTVKICSSVEEMHTAPILEAPQGGNQDTPRSPSFSWIGFPDTAKYEFVLAEDANLTRVIVREDVSTPAYHYTSNLDWGKIYFWQVRAIEPVPSEPAVGTFTVISKPAVPLAPPAVPAAPFWVWLLIGILALLNVVIIVFCLTTRR